jgi:hypothetical protein
MLDQNRRAWIIVLREIQFQSRSAPGTWRNGYPPDQPQQSERVGMRAGSTRPVVFIRAQPGNLRSVS